MRRFDCGSMTPGCAWHARAGSDAEIVLRATEHIRQVHGGVRESTVQAIKDRIRDEQRDAA